MESSFIIWRVLLMLSLFLFTQLIGVLLYYTLARLPKWLAHGLSILATGLAFFYLAPIFFFAGVREAQLRGPVGCGMPAMAAAFLVLIGTGFQLFVAVAIHIWLVRRGRTRKVPAS
jgi:hypothetical protein